MPVNIVSAQVRFAAHPVAYRCFSELLDRRSVVLAMKKVIRTLAKNTGSDERAVVAGIAAVGASVGGAILFGVFLA
jgi:hypothetical protein